MSITRPNKINTQYFTNHPKEESFVIDLQDAASDLPNDTEQHYVSAQDWRLKGGASLSQDISSVRATRQADAEPKVIATFPEHDTEELPDITADGMTVKKSGEMHLAFPNVLETALPKIYAAAMDVLKTAGEEYFRNSEITLIVQRNDIQPNSAHRPAFAGWHNHSENGENADLVYLWHDVKGTEYKTEAGEVTAPNAVLTRMGGEIKHRSQTNNTDEAMRREWGALVVKDGPQRLTRASNGMSYNNALFVKRDDPLFNQFSDAADKVLGQDDIIHVLDTPQNLAEYVEEHDSVNLG